MLYWLRSRLVQLLFLTGVLIAFIWTAEGYFARRANRRNQPAGQATAPHNSASSVAADPRAEASRLVTEAAECADQALVQIDAWHLEIAPHLETGEAIAADEDLVRRMSFVVNQPRPAARDVQSAGERLSVLQAKLGETSSPAASNPLSFEEMAELKKIHDEMLTASGDWTQAVTNARAIIRQAERQAAPLESVTLKEKMQQSSDRQALANLDAEQERNAQKAAADAVAAQAEAELLEKATSPEVMATLAPFLELRYLQPRLSGAAIRFRATNDKQPMSYGHLVSLGALAESDAGLKRLAAIGGDRDLPEPRWTVHSQPGNWSDDDREMLNRAQQMLRDYGPILVKQHRLAP